MYFKFKQVKSLLTKRGEGNYLISSHNAINSLWLVTARLYFRLHRVLSDKTEKRPTITFVRKPKRNISM